MNTKLLVRAGAACAACISILGLMAYARPVFQSDLPPLAGITRFQTEDQQLQEVAANLKQVQRQQNASDVTQAFLAQGFYQNQMVTATIALRKNPNDSGQLQLKLNAEQQLQRLNGFLATHQAHY